MKELVVVWIESYGLALKIANLFADKGGELLDCSIIGAWSQVLVRTDNIIDVENIFLEIPEKIPFKKKILKDLDPIIIDAYLSLSGEKIKDFIFVVESEFLGDGLEFSQKMIKEELAIVDFRLLRFQTPKTITVFTGNKNQLDKALLISQNYLAQMESKMSMTVVKEINSHIKNLFHLD